MDEPQRNAESPFEDPDTYDLLFAGYDEDVPFWRSFCDAGPALDLGCGTGRVTIPLLRAGLDVDGLDLWEPMLARLREKATSLGFAPALHRAPMHDFALSRRYARIVCAFNAFAHNLTAEEQVGCLRCCREHLLPGGAAAIHLSLVPPQFWLEPQGVQALEVEVPLARGTTLQLFDARTTNRLDQTQHSEMEVREIDGGGRVVSSRRTATDVRWVAKPEMELLLRLAGFSRWELLGGFDRRPLAAASDTMVVIARRGE